MKVLEALKTRRTIRKFKNKTISLQIIKNVLSAARFYPSAANLQYIECVVVRDKNKVNKIFNFTRWAGYLYPDGTPSNTERPPCFIIVLKNYRKSPEPDLRDIGAFVHSCLLGFWEYGIGSCWIASCDKKEISHLLKLPSWCKVDSVVAVGYPSHKVKAVSLPRTPESPGCKPVVRGVQETVRYYINKRGVWCVPKRPLADVVFYERYGGRRK